MTRDLYATPPERESSGVSRRGLFRLGLGSRARADIDYDGVTERVRAGWEREGHEPWLRALEPVGEVLCGLAGVGQGQRVLDAAAGDGNVAAAALALGAVVDACDLSRAQVERGRARVPDARWRSGDVQALPYPDGAFDFTVSAFGAALAPRARATARELARVTRPGGMVMLTAWVPRGLPGRLDELVPLPDGVRAPSDWGLLDVARRRLEPYLPDLQMRTRTVQLRFPDAVAFFAALTRPYDIGAEARPWLDRLLGSCNNAPPGPDGTAAAVEVDARYLVAFGRRGA